MPEGDTLHRAAAVLAALVGQQLTVEALHPRARATGVAPRLDGRRLERVHAHGKHLLLSFEGGVVLRSHLGMRGSWRLLPAAAAVSGSPWLVLRGERAVAVLRGGSTLELTARTAARLGPDVLAEPLDLDGIVDGLRRAGPGRPIGELLLDQRVVAGIGNIWRAEALWGAAISPWRPVGELSSAELESVIRQAAGTMRLSVCGSAPPRNVYRRTGRPCRRCGTPIAARRQGDHARTVYWCPACQRGDGAAGA